MTTSLQSPLPAGQYTRRTPALEAAARDVAAACAARLTRVAGTHGLLLDASACMPVPTVAGLARWTALRRAEPDGGWRGAVRADATRLPFADDACCVVAACFVGAADASVAAELARVLAPHGTLLVAGFHTRTPWRCGVAAGPWMRALRAAGLDVLPAHRCAAPWPRARGVDGLPHWLVRWSGGVWLLEARRSVLTALPLCRAKARRALEPDTLLPGVRRECA